MKMRKQIFIFGAFISLLTNVASATEPGLVGHWKFNEGKGSIASDGSGHNNHGNIYGAKWVEGKYGKALSFGGTNDYVRNFAPSGFNFAATNEITISAWFKLTGHSEYDGIVSINKELCEYRIMVDTDLHPFFDAGSHSDETVLGYSFSINTWHHYAMTVKGGKSAIIYVDGAPIASNSYPIVSGLPSGADILIGSGEGPGVHPTKGIIDEVRVYSRVLSEKEIKALYLNAVTFLPNSAEDFNSRGVANYNKNNYDQAIADYNKALKLNPKYVEAYNNRGNAYGNKRDYDRAIADYNKTLELNPNCAEAYYFRGIANHNKRDYARAIADYGKAIQLKPDYAAPYEKRKIIYREQDEAKNKKRKRKRRKPI